MIKLRVEEIQDFFKISSSIKNVSGKPELDMIKISNQNIIKTNLQIYCSKRISVLSDDDDNNDYLVDESMLNSLVKTTFASEITIDKSGNEIIISDGKNHLNHGYLDPALYSQKLILPDGDGLFVSKDIIDTIRIARSFTSSDENATNFRCVHIKDNYIFGVDFHLFYLKQFKFKFPQASLLNTHCDILTQFNSARFYNSDHYYFYKFDGGMFFAFAKVEEKVPDITPRVEVLSKIDAEAFTISKKDLVNFCELANNLTPSKQVNCSLKQHEAYGTILALQDNDYVKGYKKEIAIGGNLTPFDFNSRCDISAFRSLPQDELNCMIVSHTMVIKERDSWACISGIKID